ncbi:MAG: thioredoxin family protein [Verrucomicrobia subdivision 3 bacterium]|nr:thioredoxin family protein [Limisphaerales bacterium]
MTKEIGTEDFDCEIAGHSGLVLVDFYTEGCAPCRMLTPILDEIALENSNRLKIVKIDAAANTELAARYRVSAVPALLLFKGGQVVGQILGLKSKKDLLAWIDSQN